MRTLHPIPLLLATSLGVACAWNADRRTLAELHDVEPDVTEVRVDDSLEQAIRGYRTFLDEAPESGLTPEAMRRLADLKLEKEFGLLGDGDIAEMPAPRSGDAAQAAGSAPAPDPRRHDGQDARPRAVGIADHAESRADFERRATAAGPVPSQAGSTPSLPGSAPGSAQDAARGPREAIALYDRILEAYPTYEHRDQVLYQKARAYDELGRPDEAIAVIERLVTEHPRSRHLDEVQFRRAEYFFTRRKYIDAEEAYLAVTQMGEGSDYYELALYKLGWTFYKQQLHEKALHQYVSLLDYKVSNGYDFDQSGDEGDERRIADTFRVISLGFSELGGPEVVEAYFAAHGQRTYEHRIYSHLGEFYLEKLRYNDAAASYGAFVGLYPLHRVSPHFSMRVVEIYEAGGFPKLVLESKKEFAATYGLHSEYWRHFDIGEAPEVASYLKANLEDLASHYHAAYQDAQREEDRPAAFEEALRWYRAYLGSFPEDAGTPTVHHRLADLLLEHEDFAEAAREYERTAYGYPLNEQAAEAGYAAVFAHREHEKRAAEGEREAATREAVASTLRFVDAFPDHEHAAAVLGAAVDDLYEMREFERTIATGRRLIEEYPESEPGIRRAAWAAIAHASFDLEDYPGAEDAYARVLAMLPEDGESRQDVVDNLAASIYKQGEQASRAEEHRAAADHFLRIADVAPTSGIRPAAEYDASAALIRLEDWAGAAAVLEAFRAAYPDHELHREATRQMAFVRREQGDLVGAAEEYERVAAEAPEPDMQREALLVAGELYEDALATDRALATYLRYVEAFPEPLEMAVETRFRIAEIHAKAGDETSRHDQLRRIVEIDRRAGDAGPPRVRYLAARSALVLTEGRFHRFDEVELVQPFERNLQLKQRRMNEALDAFGALVDYEVGEVTAAATFYMAEIYSEFSRALLESERPAGLSATELSDYEMVLEEEAFPFEEKAIAVHEKNLELARSAGIMSRWIEKSVARLGVLMPGRYAKAEASSGWIVSIERYAYRGPRVADPAPEETPEEAPEDDENGLAAPAPAGETGPAETAAEADAADAPPAAPADASVSAEASDAGADPPADAGDGADAASTPEVHDAVPR